MKTAIVLLSAACLFSSLGNAVITVPEGLSPGDQYRLAFITLNRTTALSSDIAFYNDFVTAQANTSPDLVALGTTWRVIGSTSTVSAKSNTDTDDSPAGSNGPPIYRLDGLTIASDYDDLWDGTIQNPLYVAQDGTVLDTCCGTWTGTQTNGETFAASTPAEPAIDLVLPSAPLTWAERLKRVFDIDISVCPLCGGRVRVISDVTDPAVIQTILTHLKQRAPPGAVRRRRLKTISLLLPDGLIPRGVFLPAPTDNSIGRAFVEVFRHFGRRILLSATPAPPARERTTASIAWVM